MSSEAFNYRKTFFVSNDTQARVPYQAESGLNSDGIDCGCPIKCPTGPIPDTNNQVNWDNQQKVLSFNLYARNDPAGNQDRDRTDGLYLPHVLATVLRLLDRGQFNSPQHEAVQKLGRGMLAILDSQNFGPNGHKYSGNKSEAELEWDQSTMPTSEELVAIHQEYLSDVKKYKA